MQILRRPNESFCFSNGRYLYPIVTMSCYFLFCGVTVLFIFGILMIMFLSRLPIPPIFRSDLPWSLCILENHMFLDNFCCFLKFFPILDKAFHLKFLCVFWSFLHNHDLTDMLLFCSIGNFFFAGARIFFQSLDAAIFLFSRVSDIPAESLVLPVISTNDRLTLGCELWVLLPLYVKCVCLWHMQIILYNISKFNFCNCNLGHWSVAVYWFFTIGEDVLHDK